VNKLIYLQANGTAKIQILKKIKKYVTKTSYHWRIFNKISFI